MFTSHVASSRINKLSILFAPQCSAKCTQLHISTATVEVNLEVGILRFIPARKHFATDFSMNKYGKRAII